MSKLTLKQANTIIEKALAKAREMKIKPLGVVVLDDAGNIKSAQREDGATIGAAGASGGTGEEDEACCVAGIEAAGLTADASA